MEDVKVIKQNRNTKKSFIRIDLLMCIVVIEILILFIMVEDDPVVVI